MTEIDCSKLNPLILTDQHVKTLVDNLPAQCDALCNDEFFKVEDGDLKMTTTAVYKTTILSLGVKRNKETFKPHELRYLSLIFHTVQNQLIKYIEALPDVMNFVLSALGSTTYIDPPTNANKNILYCQFF